MSDEDSETGSKADRLRDAGILAEGAELSVEDMDLIESLSWEEIDAIVSIRDKLGSEFFARHLKIDLIF